MGYHFYQGSDRVLYELALCGRAVGTVFGPPGLSIDEVKRQVSENHQAAPTICLEYGEIPYDRAVKISLSDEVRMYRKGYTRIQ